MTGLSSRHREPSYRDSFHSCTNIEIWHIVNDVMKVADTGIQPLLCSHLVEIKSSGSQCLGTGMTSFFFLDPSVWALG
ncbi:hypothetical protein [Wolbachia endosymbiont (group A) of Anomoia purmunda]|uniref:hypothetical protein n=1 Tax=Wolbachia endosymbiont (group A) of Anomoia purmunda TaxID=2953978 RepID=UPI003979DCA1